ncbi:MAG: hypothetical protein CEE38_00815 [Planctomycetes bacterium B3_Pla]|nr:MAG: hypothetical protein CEE38_00815 [Planctomycetes bacterium B3_Pla]
MITCALFDLDQTLIDSAALEPLRDAHRWQEVISRMTETYVIQDVIEVLRLLRDMAIPCGVVTSSPQEYATKLLKYHHIPYDSLIADEDVQFHKPVPEPIFRALESLGVSANNTCFYIGDSPADMEAAMRAGISGILYNPSGNLLPCIPESNSTAIATCREELCQSLGIVHDKSERILREVTVLDAPIAERAMAVLRTADWYASAKRTFCSLLPKQSRAYIIGGCLRDAFLAVMHGDRYRPNDVDVVVSSVFDGYSSLTSLTDALARKVKLRATAFDAVDVMCSYQRIESWCLENAFQIRLFDLSPTIYSFLTNTIFDVTSVAFDMRRQQLVATEGFCEAIQRRRVSCVAPILYLPPLQIVRLFLLMKDHRLTPTQSCRNEVFGMHRKEYVPYYQSALRHKGKEGDIDMLVRYLNEYHVNET